jgi:hypothetical protein
MPQADLSALELQVLLALKKGTELSDVAKATHSPPLKIGEALAKLQINGFVGADGTLTDKGEEAASSSGLR